MEIWGRRGKEHHRHGRSSWYKCHTNASFEAVFNNHESHVVLKYHCCNLIWSGSVSTLCVSKYLSFSPSLLYVFNPMDIFHHLFYHCHYSPSYLQLSWYQVPSSLQRSSFCISECTYHVGITFFFFFFPFCCWGSWESGRPAQLKSRIQDLNPGPSDVVSTKPYFLTDGTDVWGS